MSMRLNGCHLGICFFFLRLFSPLWLSRGWEDGCVCDWNVNVTHQEISRLLSSVDVYSYKRLPEMAGSSIADDFDDTMWKEGWGGNGTPA
jgi:hypothetical protein